MVDSVVPASARRVVAADTSSLQSYYDGEADAQTAAIQAAFDARTLVLPPPVLTEILSDPELTPEKIALVRAIPLLPIKPGYWLRAGMLRHTIRGERYKAALAGLIAQVCIDWNVPIIVTDYDFRHFLRAGLKLIQQES